MKIRRQQALIRLEGIARLVEEHFVKYALSNWDTPQFGEKLRLLHQAIAVMHYIGRKGHIAWSERLSAWNNLVTPSPGRAPEVNMPASPQLVELLGRIFDSARQGEGKQTDYQQRRQDFIFHMTDWLGDLKNLNELYAHPEEADLREARTSLIALLYHVIPHLNAAGRLLLDTIQDHFTLHPEEPPDEETRAKPKVKRERKPETRAGRSGGRRG
jgi:hypothetical protein